MNLTGRQLAKQSYARGNAASSAVRTQFDSACGRVIVSRLYKELFFGFESIWVPQEMGRIGKRVIIPCGRATVMRVLLKAAISLSQETCPGFAAFERSRKGVQAARVPKAVFSPADRLLFLFAKDQGLAGLFAITPAFKLQITTNRRHATCFVRSPCGRRVFGG
jgi:hypothetical protein